MKKSLAKLLALCLAAALIFGCFPAFAEAGDEEPAAEPVEEVSEPQPAAEVVTEPEPAEAPAEQAEISGTEEVTEVVASEENPAAEEELAAE